MHREVVTIILVIIGSFATAKLVEWIVSRGLPRFAHRIHASFGERAVELLKGPAFHTVLLIGLGSAWALSHPPERLVFMGDGIIKTLVVLVWLSFANQFSMVLLKWMMREEGRFKAIHPATLPLFEFIAKIALLGAAAYFILVSWKINVTAWLASAGIVGIAVGFAAKDTLANLFAGVFIVADTPYRTGDYIVLEGGHRGRVTKIGLRSTRVVTRDDVEITVPNSIIANSKVINETRPGRSQRIHIPVRVGYSADIDHVRRILLETVRTTADVSPSPEPQVRLDELEDHSFKFDLRCWINDPEVRGRVRDSLNTEIFKALARIGVEVGQKS
jgi:small-conductance mechanosensitive channel